MRKEDRVSATGLSHGRWRRRVEESGEEEGSDNGCELMLGVAVWVCDRALCLVAKTPPRSASPFGGSSDASKQGAAMMWRGL